MPPNTLSRRRLPKAQQAGRHSAHPGGLHEHRRHGRAGDRRRPPRVVGRSGIARATGPSRCTATTGGRQGGCRDGRARPRWSSPGTGPARGVLVVADAVKDTSAEAVAQLKAAWSDPGPVDRRQPNRRRTGRQRGRHRPRSSPKFSRRKRSTSSPGCKPRARSSRWSATASTTPPHWRKPISGWRWAPEPTWRSRPPT